jgi:hypothetical protein
MKKRIDPRILAEDEAYLERARKIRKYYRTLTTWATTSAMLIFINLMTFDAITWAKWPVGIWGIVVLGQTIEFLFMQYRNREWEKRQLDAQTAPLPDRAQDPDTPDYSDELLREQPSKEKLSDYREVRKPWRDDDLV